MLSYLTVKETLTFTAMLRLPKSMTAAQKEQRAEEVLVKLGLTDCRNTKIGDAQSRGISGGERKRASIGIELITNPRILFLDEPTSGLDSYTAFHSQSPLCGARERLVVTTFQTLCPHTFSHL